MTIFDRIIKKTKDIAAISKREAICVHMRERLTNHDFSIISSNCIGGILSHDLKQRFNSPTINMFFEAADFVKFCSNIPYYVSLIPTDDVELTKERGYPVCNLDDIKIYCVHYQSGDQVREKWIERSKRINYDNLFIIMTDRNGLTEELISEVSKLPYPKVVFSAKPYPYDFVVQVKEFEKQSQVGQLHFYADYHGNRYYEKSFDLIAWLNHSGEKL